MKKLRFIESPQYLLNEEEYETYEDTNTRIYQQENQLYTIREEEGNVISEDNTEEELIQYYIQYYMI